MGSGYPLTVDVHLQIGVIITAHGHGGEGKHVVLQLVLKYRAVLQVSGDLRALGLLILFILIGSAVSGVLVISFVQIRLLFTGVRLHLIDLVGLRRLLGRGIVLGLCIILLALSVTRAVTGGAVLGLGLLVVPQADLLNIQPGIARLLRRVRLLPGCGQRRPTAANQRQQQQQTHCTRHQCLSMCMNKLLHLFLFPPSHIRGILVLIEIARTFSQKHEKKQRDTHSSSTYGECVRCI